MVQTYWRMFLDEAVSMSVWQIMQCRHIISVVPHIVKADAVKKTLEQ